MKTNTRLVKLSLLFLCSAVLIAFVFVVKSGSLDKKIDNQCNLMMEDIVQQDEDVSNFTTTEERRVLSKEQYDDSLYEDCWKDGCQKMSDLLKENSWIDSDHDVYLSYEISKKPRHIFVVTRNFPEDGYWDSNLIVVDVSSKDNIMLVDKFNMDGVFKSVPYHSDRAVFVSDQGGIVVGLPKWVCGGEGKLCSNKEMLRAVHLYTDDKNNYVLEGPFKDTFGTSY